MEKRRTCLVRLMLPLDHYRLGNLDISDALVIINELESPLGGGELRIIIGAVSQHGPSHAHGFVRQCRRRDIHVIQYRSQEHSDPGDSPTPPTFRL